MNSILNPLHSPAVRPRPALQSTRLLDQDLPWMSQMRRQCAHIRTVQDLLGHSDVSTTMICTHVLKIAAGTVTSPLDRMTSNA